MNVAVLIFLVFQAFASAPHSKSSALPSYAPNNPFGKWVELPTGKNYLFCGDRIIFGSSFNEKIKIQYGGNEKSMTVKEHCEFRRRELERLASLRVSEEPTLVELQYEKLSASLFKIPGGIKAGRVYSLRELRKAMKASEINDLRASNLMMPSLTEAEFAKIYARDTNNPQFIKTEHERYYSNLLTQSPAMLYTADGALYYFSLNLSNDQLKLLGSVLSGGSGGAGSSGGGSVAGGRRGSSGSNSESGISKRVANALEGARTNPFDGYKSGSRNMQVRPESTSLPASMGLDDKISFVPYDLKIPSGISRGQTRGVASGSRSSSSKSTERVKGVSVSANPSLGMMNIGGMGGGRTASGSSANVSTGSNKPTYPSSSSNSVVNTRAQSSSVAAVTTNKLSAAPVKIAGLTSPAGPPSVVFGGINYDEKFTEPNYSCKSQQWEQLLYFMNKNSTAIQHECYPMNIDGKIATLSESKFCAASSEGTEFNNLCVYEKDKKPEQVDSCYDQIIVDIASICKKYLEIPEEFNHDHLVRCAETMSALTCNKIPCEIAPILKTEGEKETISYLRVQDIDKSQIFKQVGKRIFVKKYKDVLEIPYIKTPSADAEVLRIREAAGTKVNLKNELKESYWVNTETPIAKEDFEEHLVKLTLFYNSNLSSKCKFESKSYKQSTGAGQ